MYYSLHTITENLLFSLGCCFRPSLERRPRASRPVRARGRGRDVLPDASAARRPDSKRATFPPDDAFQTDPHSPRHAHGGRRLLQRPSASRRRQERNRGGQSRTRADQDRADKNRGDQDRGRRTERKRIFNLFLNLLNSEQIVVVFHPHLSLLSESLSR